MAYFQGNSAHSLRAQMLLPSRPSCPTGISEENMPSHPQYDVAIVGASIAGCAAAIFFGRAGARVALIERDRDPAGYKRLCTHYIQASATPTLERLGLARAIEEAGGVRNDAEVFTRWGWIVAPSEQTIRRPPMGTTSGDLRSTRCCGRQRRKQPVSNSCRGSRLTNC